ncbi:hypothetical protein [Sphingobacterium hungaricum]|uniref:Uncharacterized protein n=1 Tax=Sphingobacterium hungaricum TaxID=2082723 RepID=A0A928UXU3_9SPHI|nr:hypothetical protein [Sphingobacterium hungaricum]MBE8712564.1 hypothetical protein [Sphingobacterium hungaricum]
MLTNEKLIALGFERCEWEDEGEHFVDHKIQKGNVVIEISNLEKVEVTTKGNYIELPKVDNDQKLEQLLNLLS